MTREEVSGRRIALAVLLIGVAAVVPTIVGGRPANEIAVTEVSRNEAEALTEPGAGGWADVPAARIPLTSAPSSVPNANETTVEEMRVQAAYSDRRLFFRLSWDDRTRDGVVTPTEYEAPRVGSFADSVAVQLPVNQSGQPPIAMGSPASLVNLWYWNPVMGSQALLAGGPGTTTALNESTMRTNASYRNGTWNVVVSRALRVEGSNQTNVGLDRNLNTAFAVWNGSNEERSGRKSVSEWYRIPFADEDRGPPYETILWIIAGVMITVVLVVTALAVRRGER